MKALAKFLFHLICVVAFLAALALGCAKVAETDSSSGQAPEGSGAEAQESAGGGPDAPGAEGSGAEADLAMGDGEGPSGEESTGGGVDGPGEESGDDQHGGEDGSDVYGGGGGGGGGQDGGGSAEPDGEIGRGEVPIVVQPPSSKQTCRCYPEGHKCHMNISKHYDKVFPETYKCPDGEVCLAGKDAEFGTCWRRCDLGAETPHNKGLVCAPDETCLKKTVEDYEGIVWAVEGYCIESCKLIGAPKPCH
jgi:hypothetical protein